MNSTKRLAVSVATLAFVVAEPVGAYCVHNKSDVTMQVSQYANGSFWKPFKATLDPGQQSCCSWTTKDCNKSGGETDAVDFKISHAHGDDLRTSIAANGDLYIQGRNGNYYCTATP